MNELADVVEAGLQMLQDRRRTLGQPTDITQGDRSRIARQLELAHEPWEQARQALVSQPDLVAALDDLWPRVIPYLIKGNEVSPVHHIAHVVSFMARIGLIEVSPIQLKQGVLAALFHDIGIGDCALPKISEASIQRAGPVERERLRRDGIASRLEHMKLGAAIASKQLLACQQQHPEFLTSEDVDVIVDIVGSHDFSKIPLMEDHVDRRWLLSPDQADWLKQCHWEADALWMLTPAGILVDLERENEENTPENRRAKFLFNLGLHRQIISLYASAYSPAEMNQFGFHDGLLYRSRTGYGLAVALEQLNATNP
ncbi:MAG: hypothetical protein JSS49_12790 [Planctomycetes bacterium]|nr:hypothetical protein [Planctomycetota bacterium]